MTRTLGSGIAADILLAQGERVALIAFDFADTGGTPTPVYLTTAARDISWDSKTWQAVGGRLDLDALGESADDPSNGHRLVLSGVDQTVLALILGSRWRGRMATIYYAALDQAAGTVKTNPVVMFSGPMNGGFEVNESRGDFGGGSVDITGRLTSRLDELVKMRGVRTNVQSHQATIASAAGDLFFQHVDNLALRKVYWGTTDPYAISPTPMIPGGDPRPLPPPRTDFPGTGGGDFGPGGTYTPNPPAPRPSPGGSGPPRLPDDPFSPAPLPGGGPTIDPAPAPGAGPVIPDF